MCSSPSREGNFKVLHHSSECRARVGLLRTPHGEIQTPAFAPVGTQGVVKTLLSQELERLGVELVLANTYHLMLRPGEDLIQRAGGLHRFMSWPRSILTDSGGYQVFSLEKLRRITEEGVEFRSHIDGSLHFLSPEKSIDIQWGLGSDILMCLDECPAYPVTQPYAATAMRLTLRWSRRCLTRFNEQRKKPGPMLFGIVQGSVYMDLRRESAERTAAMEFPGLAVGGLAVGEPQALMYEVLDQTLTHLPEDRPRYLMGVGNPEDLWEAIGMGVDFFDCVLPTRNGRNGQLFTSQGKLNMKNASFRDDFRPPDSDCECDLCSRYSRAYLHHLFRAGELSALRLASLHNVSFMLKLAQKIRNAVRKNQFFEEKKAFLSAYHEGSSYGGSGEGPF